MMKNVKIFMECLEDLAYECQFGDTSAIDDVRNLVYIQLGKEAFDKSAVKELEDAYREANEAEPLVNIDVSDLEGANVNDTVDYDKPCCDDPRCAGNQ